jgi:hypothetical protein
MGYLQVSLVPVKAVLSVRSAVATPLIAALGDATTKGKGLSQVLLFPIEHAANIGVMPDSEEDRVTGLADTQRSAASNDDIPVVTETDQRERTVLAIGLSA